MALGSIGLVYAGTFKAADKGFELTSLNNVKQEAIKTVARNRSIFRQAFAGAALGGSFYCYGLYLGREMIRQFIADDKTDLGKKVGELYKEKAGADYEVLKASTVGVVQIEKRQII